MSAHALVAKRRRDDADKAMRAAMVTIQHASIKAMTAAPTVARQAAVAEATEYAVAAIKGMARALDRDWMEG